ncbi:MAG: putative lipid II flippase FtsW [Eubacteriales bacterium]|nr:putative lipid II flippase FtsW [Eubacteriales bacterium]MDY3332151.1 putative lipid II flippase FtsW [Gallibacter sp.]
MRKANKKSKVNKKAKVKEKTKNESRIKKSRGHIIPDGIDKRFFFVVIFLVMFGVAMIFSASYYWAMARNGSISFYLFRMIPYSVIAVVGMIIFARIDYHKLTSMYKPLYLMGVLLLAMVKYTPLGVAAHGAKRWLGVGGFTFQPAEMIKFITIIVVAVIISKARRVSDFEVIAKVVMCVGVYLAFIMMQPNMSTVMTIAFTVAGMFFIAGLEMKWFIGLGSIGIAGAVYLALSASYRLSRVASFLDPFHDPSGESFQVVQSLLALGSGGLFGRGPGNSVQKNLYLPEPHTDFIMAIIGEELGFIGLVVLIMMFSYLIYRGFKIALEAPDKLGTLIASGIIILIGFQVIANIAIVTSSMPATGVGLPFISYGGTSIIFFCGGAGIMLNISRQTYLSDKKRMINNRELVEQGRRQF